MMKQIFKTIAVLGLVVFAGSASAEVITGHWGIDIGDASADFVWEVKADGELVIQITNTSGFAGAVSAFRFELGSDSSVSEVVEVAGTGADGMWDYTTEVTPCFVDGCMIAGSDFWGGYAADGIAAGSTATFRFVGDFTNLTDISRVLVRWLDTGSSGTGRGSGMGCEFGCQASEVPEPGTLMMFAAGLFGFGLVARRRRLI